MDEEKVAKNIELGNFLNDRKIPSNTNLRSEMAQEIISNKPDFAEKWTLYIFCGILVAIFISTIFIKYPDTIGAPALLTSENAPKEIIPRHEGRLTKLIFHNNDKVKAGDILGWIESTADHQEVISLSAQIDTVVHNSLSGKTISISNAFNSRFDKLGEIQQGYQQFMTAWQNFNDYTSEGFFAKKKLILENDIKGIMEAHLALQQQKKLITQDITLSAESFKMYESLENEKVLTKEEFRAQKSRLINKQVVLPQLESSILSNESQLRDKQKEIEQLDHDFSQQQTVFNQALLSLKSTVDDWKKKYVLESPVNGIVNFVIPLQENQYLQAGKLLGYVNPNNSHFYAEANLTQVNLGKISTGMKVQLRFDAYPYEEFGFLEGTLQYVSKVPSDDGFLATISLNHGLLTNNNRLIPYKNGLKAQALIITKNIRLSDRLYYMIVKSTSVDVK
jgi:HlyD family secretion protein